MTTKVFVGNLSFKMKEEELRAEFEAAGKVLNANIITRGPRSLGYGFVELENEEVAKKAVELLHKKEIDGRPINVEIAKPREDQSEENGFEKEESAPSRGGRGGSRGGYVPRGRGGFRGRGRGNFSRGGRGGRTFVPRAKPSETEDESKARIPSKTTLFVANLPFSFTDESFKKVFTDIGLKPKSVKVVTKQNGRSKGFGFVEFEDEASQKKALEQINSKEVEGRELTVRIALTEESSDGVKTSQPVEEKKPEKKQEKKPEKKPEEK